MSKETDQIDNVYIHACNTRHTHTPLRYCLLISQQVAASNTNVVFYIVLAYLVYYLSALLMSVKQTPQNSSTKPHQKTIIYSVAHSLTLHHISFSCINGFYSKHVCIGNHAYYIEIRVYTEKKRFHYLLWFSLRHFFISRPRPKVKQKCPLGKNTQLCCICSAVYPFPPLKNKA